MSLDSQLRPEIERQIEFARKRPFDYQMMVIANDMQMPNVGLSFFLTAFLYSDSATEEMRSVLTLGTNTIESSPAKSYMVLLLGGLYLSANLAFLCGRALYAAQQQRNLARNEMLP